MRLLEERGAVLALGRVESDRGSWQGLELLTVELERQTGVGIAPDALTELARRTLRQENDSRGRSTGGVDADSTARFAGEYRKLANLAEEGASTASWWSRRWRTGARRTSGSSSTPSPPGAGARPWTASTASSARRRIPWPRG